MASSAHPPAAWPVPRSCGEGLAKRGDSLVVSTTWAPVKMVNNLFGRRSVVYRERQGWGSTQRLHDAVQRQVPCTLCFSRKARRVCSEFTRRVGGGRMLLLAVSTAFPIPICNQKTTYKWKRGHWRIYEQSLNTKPTRNTATGRFLENLWSGERGEGAGGE